MFKPGWSEALDFVPLHVTINCCFFFLTLLYKLQGFNKVWKLIPAFKGIGKTTGVSHTSSMRRNPQAAPSVLMLRTVAWIQSPAGGMPGIPGSPAGARLELKRSLSCTPPVTPQLLRMGSRDRSLLGCAGPGSHPALCPNQGRKAPHQEAAVERMLSQLELLEFLSAPRRSFPLLSSRRTSQEGKETKPSQP